jgi:hypothetical protein
MKRPDHFIALTKELNTATIPGRLEVLRCIINITRILLSTYNILLTESYPYGKVSTRGDSTITYHFNCIEKKVLVEKLPYSKNPDVRLQFLQNMYNHAKGHPTLVELFDGPKFGKSKIHYYVSFTTMGVHVRPHNENEVRGFAKNVISALA